MTDRELLASMAATIVASGRRCPDEAVSDAVEILSALEKEYKEREIQEGITSYQLSADDADFDGWVRR